MAILVAVAALTTSLLLLASGAAHARRPGALGAALAAHGVVRRTAPVVPALPAAELALGAATVVAELARVPWVLALLLAGQVLLFSAFAVYLSRVARRGGQGLACGCGLPEVPVGPHAVARAAGLAALAAFGAAGTLTAGVPSDTASVAVVTVAAPTLALLLAVGPAARRQPLLDGLDRIERGAVA